MIVCFKISVDSISVTATAAEITWYRFVLPKEFGVGYGLKTKVHNDTSYMIKGSPAANVAENKAVQTCFST